jgi:hypothetical protein
VVDGFSGALRMPGLNFAHVAHRFLREWHPECKALKGCGGLAPSAVDGPSGSPRRRFQSSPGAAAFSYRVLER